MAAEIVLGQAGLLVPGRWRWARALAWLCLLAVLCVGAFNVAADASLRASAMMAGEVFTSRAAAPAGARLIGVIVGSMAMLAVYALGVAIVERRTIPELGLRRALPELAIGLAIGFALIAAIVGVLWGAGWVTIVATVPSKVLESLKMSVQSGVIEEVLTRIVIFRLLWRAAGALPALIATAVLFGALHLSNPDATAFSALCLIAGEGIGAGLYVLSGRVWMSIGMHAGWNFAQGWIFGSAVSGLDDFAGGPLLTRPVDGIDAMLSGGGFGPESSVPALVVSLAASALCLGLAWRRGRFAVS